MNYQLKQNEKDAVEAFLKAGNRQSTLLREFVKWQGFGLNDVLIRYRITADFHTGKIQRDIDNVSNTCEVPKKFRIVYIDDIGVPWVKQLSVRGGLGNKLYCLADYSPGCYEFEVDPAYVDSILLGTSYDPRAEYRLMRKENPRYGGNNKKS